MKGEVGAGAAIFLLILLGVAGGVYLYGRIQDTIEGYKK